MVLLKQNNSKQKRFDMKIQTKKNEIIKTTANPKMMIGKFLKKSLHRRWIEDFGDEDSGEVVYNERKELIFQAGTLLDGDTVAKIMFNIQAGEICEIEVSNQKREAFFTKDNGVDVWCTVIEANNKKVKLLLYANSAEMAIEASRDFIELNYSGSCKTKSVKDFGDYILIDNQLTTEGEEGNDNYSKKVYKFEVVITQDEEAYNKKFLVFASDTETAMININDWLIKNQSENSENTEEFKIALETVTVVPCNHIIEKEFSEAYF